MGERREKSPEIYGYESRLQEKTIQLVKEKYGTNVWVFKTHDQCRIGIPDLLLCFYGHFVAIELKRTPSKKRSATRIGEVHEPNRIDYGVTPMQKYNITQINNAGGTAFATTNTSDIMDRLEKIKQTLGYL